MIRAGAKPKVTMSAKLSKSFPIEDETFNKRAKKPSKKSNTIERPIKYEPKIKSPSKILIIENNIFNFEKMSLKTRPMFTFFHF